MTPVSIHRRAAIHLVQWALRLSMPDTKNWGRAMLAEMDQVRSNGAAWSWALSCSFFLVRRSFASRLSTVWRANKGASVVALTCWAVAAALAMTPTFRQAMNTSLTCWKILWSRKPPSNGFAELHRNWPDSDLAPLIRSAETEHDAATLVFIAERTTDANRGAQLADEAVTLDPSLTWAYSIVSCHFPQLATIPRWVDRLHSWDPQNALPHLITAEIIDIQHVRAGTTRDAWYAKDDAWRTAMTAAFDSQRFDDYSSRQFDLDRNVVQRRHLTDPLLFIEGFNAGYLGGSIPSFAVSDSVHFAGMLTKEAQQAEAAGDHSLADARNRQVKNFKDIAVPVGADNRSMAIGLSRLSALLRPDDLVLVRPEQREQVHQTLEQARGPEDGIRRLQDSALAVVALFGVLIVLSALLVARPFNKWMRLAVLAAAGGFIAFAFRLYVEYRPLAEIFVRFIQSGDYTNVEIAKTFRILSMYRLLSTLPLGLSTVSPTDLIFHGWIAFTALCSVVLLALSIRHVRTTVH